MEPVSLYFFWRREFFLGIATHFGPPILVTALLVGLADLEARKNSRIGQLLRRYMTRAIEGIRLAADILMVLGAWFHYASLIVLGVVIVILAWCTVLLRQRPEWDTAQG